MIFARSLASAAFLAAAAILAPPAAAQVLPDTAANRAHGVVGCTQTTSGITCPGGGGGGGGGYSARYQQQQFMNQMMVNTMQGLMNNFWEGYQRGLAIRRQKQAALNINDAGLAYAKKGNWSAAVNSFRRALNLWNHPTIRKNLAWAEDELSGRAEARRQAERARRARIAGMIGNLADKLGKPAPDTTPAGTQHAKNELEFLTPKGTAFFGQGGESPPPVDTRDDLPDENGLAFIRPKGVPADVPKVEGGPLQFKDAPNGGAGGEAGGPPVQVASNDPAGGLQFIDPDSVVDPAGAATANKGSLHLEAESPKAAVLLDALAYGNRDWDKSRTYLLDLRKRYPDDENVKAALVELDHVRKLAEAVPPGTPHPPSPEVAALEQKGREMIRSGNFLEARDAFHEALMKDPAQDEIHDLLNSTHMLMLKEADEYRAKARKAIRDGNYAEAEVNLRAVVRRVPYDGDAKRQLEAAEARDPTAHLLTDMVSQSPQLGYAPRMAVERSDRDLAGGNYGGAVAELEKAARMAPKDEEVREKFFRARAMDDAENGKVGQSLTLPPDHPYALAPEEGRRGVPKNVETLISHSEEALHAGDYKKAVADMREAQSLAPENQDVMDYLSYVEGLRDHAARNK